ncbi:hypothetical protein BDP81DRAFT_408365 [Colletotrichum phormii]|uniref:Uncharacterized protein n=1 Tax=Colletotrichum phormii TaxID=359342 RepID=A0AAI9ZLD5_9PEZI|nr:uncharacterized protein BDP81DRAFT_408365 [Colletotrichum phormii]KAK1633831.1 hypothetical protein BDP81DRAFT_408365 [Colletotrichum phormii]
MWNMSCPTVSVYAVGIPEASHESQVDVSCTSRRFRAVPHVAPQPPGEAVSNTWFSPCDVTASRVHMLVTCRDHRRRSGDLES